jgi:RecA-family ATPase
MREPVIDRLVRIGETATIVSNAKVGKSWLMILLALCMVTGREFLGAFACSVGRVLYIDHELHRETLQFRIHAVADDLGIPEDHYANDLQVWSLRSRRRDIHGISRRLKSVQPGYYSAIINDAIYRLLPAGMSEADDRGWTEVADLIDEITERLSCCWVNVHHSSKGSQGEKRVTDVGSGSGSQSRTVDSHIVVREHEKQDVAVID